MTGISGELVRAVKNNKIVPFVGAGVSMGIKPGLFPSWKALIEHLAEMIADDGDTGSADRVRHLRDSGDYPQAAEVAFQRLGAFRFNRELRGAIRVPRPEDGDFAVPRGIWSLRPPLVITTNYDEVLRWACPIEPAVVANDQSEELALLDDDKSSDSPWIWHLHGTIHRLGTVILAGGDYRRLYENDGSNRVRDYDNALFRLRSVMAAQPLLYVGFSLSDPYVLQQIKHVLDLTDRKGPPSYALMKEGQGDAAALWSNYNIQLIEYPDHGGPLAALLQQIAQRAFGGPRPAAASAPWAAPPLRPTPPGFESMPGLKGLTAPSPPTAPGFGPPPSMLSANPVLMAAEAGESPPDRAVDILRVVEGTRHPGVESAAAPLTPMLEALESSAPPPRPVPVPRPDLEDEIHAALREHRCLLLLSPRRGGARTLARRIAERHFASHVTWLSPPNVPGGTDADFYRSLAAEYRSSADSLASLEAWLTARARAAGGDHLIVVKHDGGPPGRLIALGEWMKALVEAGGIRFFILVAGGAACARLRFEAPPTSLFAGALARHAPPLSVAEVADALANAGLDRRKAAAVHAAIGGLPGLLEEVLLSRDLESIDARLAVSPAVSGMLHARLSEDDRQSLKPEWHARWVLGEMLAGRPVRRLADVEDQLQVPEVRLYYDGLVVADDLAAGATVFRCAAARAAAAEALGPRG